MTHPAVVIRRSALNQTGGYDERFITSQDLDLFLRLSEVGEVKNLDELLFSWRQHSKSVNRTRSATWHEMKRLALKKTLDRCTADQIALELFPSYQQFSFPAKPLDVAKHAEIHGSYSTAIRLAGRAWVRGGCRAEASYLALKACVKASLRRIKKIIVSS